MISFFKTLCLATYALALAVPFVTLPLAAGPYVQKLALILFAAHILELPIAYRYLRIYKGPLIDSVALSLLYGLLHWQPLAKASKQNADR
jgi:hypothetical protein